MNTEGSHPTKWRKTTASDLICFKNLVKGVSQQRQQDQQVEYQKGQCAEPCTKYQIRRKEEQHRRPQKTLTRFMLNGSLSGTLLWCLEGRRNEFDILFKGIEHRVAGDDAKDTGNR